MAISIEITNGNNFVTKADETSARTAAESVLAAFEWRGGDHMQIDHVEAYTAYQRHMSDEDYMRSPRDTTLIAAWKAAQSAADIALTKSWRDPDGASCTIAAW